MLDCVAHRIRNVLSYFVHVPTLPFGFGDLSVAGGCVKALPGWKSDRSPCLGVTLNKPNVFYLIWLKNIFILLGSKLSIHHTNSSLYLCCLNQLSEIQQAGSVGTAVKLALSTGNATSKTPLVLRFFVFFFSWLYHTVA